MSELYFLASDSLDVYENQAMEKYLLDHVKPGEIILYLWRNDNCVVIGRNQDAYGECDVGRLENNNGHLARRISGGGAVYHDKGNLNFTFICGRDLFDIERQDQVILNALKSIGIKAEKNGRNDLLIDGRKFSGHAYYRGKESCLHHGTLMLKVDEEKLASYLHVSLLKLQSKKVSSVRSRILNLKDVKEDLDIEMLQKALLSSFEEEYGKKAKKINIDDLYQIEALKKEFSDPKWLYGTIRDLPYRKEKRFDWGTVKVYFDLKEGMLCDLKIYTDALDHEFPEHLEKKLIGQSIETVKAENGKEQDIVDLLKEVKDEI